MTLQYFESSILSVGTCDGSCHLLPSPEAEPPLWTGVASYSAAPESPGNPWSPPTPDHLYPASLLVFRLKRKRPRRSVTTVKIHFAVNTRQSKHCSPLRVLPAFVLGFLAAVFLRLVFPILPLPPPLLPLLLLGRFAAAGNDAVQHPLVSVRVSGVSFH